MSVSFLSECKEKVLNRIDALLPDANKIVSAMRYSALAESKCIRAGLVFASGNLNNEISNSALVDMATSIELMHTYSLIHDDLPSMDNDDMRRGQASNHVKYNEATAILAGDALQALAYETIASSLEMTPMEKIYSIKALANACGHKGMILGQQYDLDAEKNEYNDIKKIHELKTGKLIQVAMTMPHLGNQKQKNQLTILDQVGKDLGLAFQIMDDVLEVSTDSSMLGKSNQSDLINKKLTYVSAYGKQESINQAHALSNACIAKLEDSFDKNKVMNLLELAKFMVERER
ncbi:polyprenyl synthetase family protein [Gammaproteobacteria bacterium]|nr:polyprenyl synthetase family protein [Gammaproteobacteria bacterium]